ncbi:MAG: permease-like cell division protein FtsX [Clostridium sp.]|nr:permease-like cell division protein FtsX [Clostridium sp.]
MKPNKRHSILPVVSSQLTAVASVAMVLFTLGLVALIAIAAQKASDAIREQVGFVVIMDENATEQQISAVKAHWLASERVSRVTYSSADDVLERWNEQMSSDASDASDLLDGFNPFLPEFEINMKAEHADPDSIAAAVASASSLSGIREIRLYPETAGSVTATVSTVIMVLIAVGAILLAISVALINNTIRLTIYSRRFMIHTMRLVGATAGFIRRPFVNNSMVSGLISSLIAVAALGGLAAWLRDVEPALEPLVTPVGFAWVAAVMILAGIAICALAAIFATNKYINLRYDEMFRQ